MTRKTIKIDTLKTTANNMLANGTGPQEGRLGVQMLLESMLHNVGAYEGFRYLSSDEIPAGQAPGINGNAMSLEDKFDGTDNSRVRYL